MEVVSSRACPGIASGRRSRAARAWRSSPPRRGRVGPPRADGRCAVDVRYVRRGTRFGVQLCVQPVAALFPECASTVMSALSGAFQVSGLVFLALTAGDEREIAFYVFSSRRRGRRRFCLCYVMLPRGQSFLEAADEDASPRRRRRPGRARQRHSRGTVTIGRVFRARRRWFTVVVCPMQFYISAIGYALETKGDTTGEYSSIFSAAYGAVAVFSAVGGRVADKIGQGACLGLATASVAISFAILCLPKSAGQRWQQVFGMTCTVSPSRLRHVF